MPSPFSRTEMLLGAGGMRRLQESRVAVFGLGGVGGYAAEALARSGVGTLDLIDDDVISLTNLNRQIYALHSTLGEPKVEVAARRIHDISPGTAVHPYRCFFSPETAKNFDFSEFDYVADCIDTVMGKLCIIECAKKAGVPVISCMGTGNQLDPGALKISDIYETRVCPLARVMRHELKKRGITSLKVVSSEVPPEKPLFPGEEIAGRRVPGSTAFVPPVAGMLIAGDIVRTLTERNEG